MTCSSLIWKQFEKLDIDLAKCKICKTNVKRSKLSLMISIVNLIN